jgi:hypothetical protein
MVKDSFSIASMPKNATGKPSKKALDNGRLKPYLAEDSDLDETVNFNDLNTLAKNWRQIVNDRNGGDLPNPGPACVERTVRILLASVA